MLTLAEGWDFLGGLVILAAAVFCLLWLLVPVLLLMIDHRVNKIATRSETRLAAVEKHLAIIAECNRQVLQRSNPDAERTYRVTGTSDAGKSSYTVKAESRRAAIAMAQSRGIRVTDCQAT